MILPALLLASLVAAASTGEEESATAAPQATQAAQEQPAPARQDAPATPLLRLEPAPPDGAPPLLAHPAPPDALPASPGEREPEPCGPATGSTIATGCSPTPGAPPDPSQPRTRRRDDLDRDDGLVGWTDTGHGWMESGLAGLVQRLDGFFGDPTYLRLDPPAFSARIRGGLRLGQDRRFSDQSSVVADVRLPSLDRALSRARIFIAGGSEDEQVQSQADEGLLPPRSASLGTSRGALEARFDLLRAYRTRIDLGAGVRFRWIPAPYTRIRFAHAEELGLGLVGHVSQTGFWERDLGLGESTRLDVERVIGRDTVLRTWGIGTLHQRSRGLEWAAELGVAQALGRRNGLYVAGALQGATRPELVDRYRVYSRVRRDLHGAWLFGEVEPEVAWPLQPTGTRPSVLAVTFRLEVQLATLHR